MAEFPYIDWLARDYKRRAEVSGKWTDYVKAHGIANFCVVKDSTEVRRKLVYDIEDSWYNGQHPLSYVEHQQLIKQHKSCLKSYREETKDDYKQLDAEATKFDLDGIFNEEYLDKARSFSDKVFDQSKKCCHGLVDISRRIIESSVDLLKRSKQTTSCGFVVIGLGSIAKGEATPYSDLEYAFIVEPGDSEYFEKLAVDSYFRIGNLGETPLKYFDIDELKVTKNTTSTTDIDNVPIVPNDIAAGYRIDGLMKKAGNIPTGNGRIDGRSLTLTVQEFIELYKTSAEAPFDGMPGDLSDMLASSVVIYTNEGQTSQLYDEFVRARMAYECTKDGNVTSVNKKRLDSFKADVREYTFLPNFVRFQPPNNMDIKIKTDIFRYPTLLANNIKMFLRLNNRYSWESFSHLHTEKVLSDVNYRYLNIVLALSIYMRTSAYIGYGSQTEILSLIPSIDSTSQSKYNVPKALFIIFGCLLSPIKQSVMKDVETIPSENICLSNITLSIFGSIVITEVNYFQNAEVCYFAGHYHLAKKLLEIALGTPVEPISLEQFQQAVEQASEKTGIIRKLIELCGYILYYTGSYNAAIKYLQWIITNNPDREDITLLKLLTARCIKEQGDFQTSRTLLNEVEQHLTEHGKEFYVADSNHGDSVHSYNSVGIVYRAMREYQKALVYFTKALRMYIAIYGETEDSTTSMLYNNIGVAYNGIGNHTLALEYHIKSLDMRKAIYGANTDHQDIANSYNSIGNAHNGIGNHTLALEYYIKSLDIQKAIYGANTDHPDIAGSYSNIGTAYKGKGNRVLALEYRIKSLDMRKAIYGANTDHSGIASSYNSIGNAYNGIGNHTLALEYFIKSLDMRKAIYGAKTDHPYIANSYNNIGNAFNSIGNHALALEYHFKSLDMRKAVHGANTDHQGIASSYNNIGVAYSGMGNHALALEYHIKSLDMKKAIYGANTDHPYIANSYNNIGNAHNDIGNHTLALEYYIKSLDIQKAIYGANTDHPDVAGSYSNIGTAYKGKGNHVSALEYHFKSLDMRKAIYGANTGHSGIASSYNSIGNAYNGIGNHTLALEYFIKSLDMRKAIYGANTDHPYIANSYNNIGNAYSGMGNHTLALQYCNKSLDMRKAIHGANTDRPDIAKNLQQH